MAVTLQDSTTFHYVTVATKPHRNLSMLQELCTLHGHQLTVLAMGNTELTRWGVHFFVKLREVHRHVANLSPSAIVCFTDAYDVMCVDNAEAIYQKFKRFDADLVFSSESYCHPDATKKAEYERVFEQLDVRPQTSHRYLNSGTFIGYAGAIRDALASTPYDSETDDQGYWTSIYLANALKPGKYASRAIVLDFSSQIFVCLADGIQQVEFKHNASGRHALITVRETNTHPSFLHLNSGVKQHYSKLYHQYTSNRNTNSSYAHAVVCVVVLSTLAIAACSNIRRKQ